MYYIRARRNIILLMALFSSLLFSYGCAGRAALPQAQSVPIGPTALPENFGSHAEKISPSDGSLFVDERGVSLASDFRGRRIGDIVTIILQENMKGAKNVKTSTAKQSSFNLGLSGLFGFHFKKQLGKTYPNETIDPTKAIGGDVKDSFDGSGKTSRDASLTGTVSARIVDVLPGGSLAIKGTRALKINNETQYLTISGVVRQTDIGPDNTVLSTKIADARIEYTGSGIISEKQTPGWAHRILGIISPF